MKNFFKKSWKFILGFIGFFMGIFWLFNSTSKKKVKEIENKIKDNESETKFVEKQIEEVIVDKEETKKEIEVLENKIKAVEDKKPNIETKNGEQAFNDLKNRLNK